MFLRRVALLLGLLAVVSACGAAASGQGVDPPATAAVGGLPPATPTTAPEPTTTTSTAVVRTTVTLPLDAKVGRACTRQQGAAHRRLGDGQHLAALRRRDVRRVGGAGLAGGS
ncbi:MAG: hypothetical protein IPP16_00180 [Acidimicrobiaceae bacterium]|nr:hypothetical protein [Acidimicrobiaceae bacterium]